MTATETLLKRIRELQDEKLFGVVPDPERIVHDQRSRRQPIQQVRRRDVMHVEGRILPQPHHVVIRQIDLPHLPEMRVVALNPLHGQVLAARGDPALVPGEVIRQVEEELVPPRLRLLGQPERTVGIDVHPGDRVHLEGDFHERSPGLLWLPLHGPAANGAQWAITADPRRRHALYPARTQGRRPPRIAGPRPVDTRFGAWARHAMKFRHGARLTPSAHSPRSRFDPVRRPMPRRCAWV